MLAKHVVRVTDRQTRCAGQAGLSREHDLESPARNELVLDQCSIEVPKDVHVSSTGLNPDEVPDSWRSFAQQAGSRQAVMKEERVILRDVARDQQITSFVQVDQTDATVTDRVREVLNRLTIRRIA